MKPERPTWLEIDLGAISNNVQQLRNRVEPNCILMGVVKANAYGHGAVQTAQAVVEAGASRLAVATLVEAIELRNAKINVPILVLGYTPKDLAGRAIDNDITLTAYDYGLIQAMDRYAASYAKQGIVHIKINTGMNRLGLHPRDSSDYLSYAKTLTNVHVEGIYTHFATADESNQSFAQEQFQRFLELLGSLEATKLRPPIAHAANSAATLSMPETHLDMVRPGIAIYGLHPDPESNRLPAGFRAALMWKAQIAHINRLEPGEAVSYGREFVASRPTTVAVIPVGYADGFPRKPLHWSYILVNGKPAPIVGRVCMDQTMIDISAIYPSQATTPIMPTANRSAKTMPLVNQGDEVILIGWQKDASLSAEDVAEQIGTNNYDVVSRIMSRVPRIYV